MEILLPCSLICCLHWGHLNLQAKRLLCMPRQCKIKLKVQRKKLQYVSFHLLPSLLVEDGFWQALSSMSDRNDSC